MTSSGTAQKSTKTAACKVPQRCSRRCLHPFPSRTQPPITQQRAKPNAQDRSSGPIHCSFLSGICLSDIEERWRRSGKASGRKPSDVVEGGKRCRAEAGRRLACGRGYPYLMYRHVPMNTQPWKEDTWGLDLFLCHRVPAARTGGFIPIIQKRRLRLS